MLMKKIINTTFKISLDRFLQKLRTTSQVERTSESGGPLSFRTAGNIAAVALL